MNKEINKKLLQYKEGFLDKKVLLVTLDSPFLDNSKVFPYLGILYLAAIAKRLGKEVEYFKKSDVTSLKEKMKKVSFFYTDEFDIENVKEYLDFNLICFSCFTPQANQAYRIKDLLKEAKPDIQILAGGPHSTYYVDECVSEGFDMVCIGDGERVFESLLKGDIKTLEKVLHPLTTETNLIFKDQLNEAEMDQYPIPLRQKEYIGEYNYIMKDRIATTIVNSRGCPMGCEFCEHRKTIGRWHSVDHFKEEVESIVKLGIKGIMIFDDLFAISPKKVSPYLEILRKHHEESGLISRCFGHAKTISKYPEMAVALAKAGCVEFAFGAESASQEILDAVGKGTKVNELHNFVDYSIEAGLNVKSFFMIGLPGENNETFQETYSFIKKYRDKYPDHFDFDLAAFFPYKGTKIGDVIRLPEGTKRTIDGAECSRRSVKLRAKDGLSWKDIDNGNFGVYKGSGGASDIVVETYDWKKEEVLLSVEQIYQLKEKTMLLSRRYTDSDGKRVYVPQIEGSIGSDSINENKLKQNEN